MITRFKQQVDIPYSLHDMIVNQIILEMILFICDLSMDIYARKNHIHK